MEVDLAMVINLEIPFPDNSTPLLKRILCIHYPLQFRKNQYEIQALIDFGSKVNAMTPTYAKKLDF